MAFGVSLVAFGFWLKRSKAVIKAKSERRKAINVVIIAKSEWREAKSYNAVIVANCEKRKANGERPIANGLWPLAEKLFVNII